MRHVPEDVECRGIVWAPYIRHAAHVEPRAQLRVAVARYAMQREVRAGQDPAQPCNERWQLLEPARGASADEGALVDNDVDAPSGRARWPEGCGRGAQETAGQVARGSGHPRVIKRVDCVRTARRRHVGQMQHLLHTQGWHAKDST